MFQLKDIEWLTGLKNKTDQYVAYKRLTSEWKTHTAWKLEDGKDTSCQWKQQESGGNNTHIRQNRLFLKKSIKKDKEEHYIR